MLIALIVFCIVVSVAAGVFKDLLPHVIQYGFFLRFPILIALLLILLGFAKTPYIPDLFEFQQRELIEVTALALLAAWTCLSTAIVLSDAAPHRFGVARLPLPHALLRWGMVWSPLLAAPLLIRIGWSSRADPWVLLKMGLGVVFAFAIQWILRMVRQLFVPPDANTPLLIPPALVPNFIIQARPLGWLWRKLLPPDRLRKFPRVIGAGYISYSRGTIQPGPIWLLVLLGIVSLSCTYSNASLDWRLAHKQQVIFMPPMAYLEISLILLALLLSGLSFFLDRYRISVVMVIILWIVVPYWTNSTGHYFMIHQADCALGGHYDDNTAICSGPPPLTSAVAPWLTAARHKSSHKPTMIVVCASGGGTQASAWTARVLTGLQEEFGADLVRSMRLYSGVSGGSLGLFYFLSSFDSRLGAPPTAQLPYINEAAQQSTGDSLVRGIVENDLLRKLAPFGESYHDRGWDLEHTWASSMLWLGYPRVFRGRLSDWRAGVRDGWMPGTIFNTTLVETGGPMIFSTVDIPRSDAVIFGKSHSA